MSERIRIVVADDHPAFRRALQQVIDATPDMVVVAAVGEGVSALEEIRRLAPDVAVLDIRMPGVDGIEIVRCLTDDRPRVRTVIVTMHADRVLFESAMTAGATGYVLKDRAFSEVVGAIRAAARGHSYVSPSLSTDPGRAM